MAVHPWLRRPGPWTARWIWADRSNIEASGSHSARTVVLLATDFEVAQVPAEAPCRLTSVSRHLMLVNGVELVRGPVRSNPRQQPWDEVDLAPWLHPGHNRLAAMVWLYHQAMAWWLPMPGSKNDLREGAFVLEAQIGDQIVASGDSWLGRQLPGWRMTQPAEMTARGLEVADLSELPADWSTGELDGSWRPVSVRKTYAPGSTDRTTPPSYPLGPTMPRPTPVPTPVARQLQDIGGGHWSYDGLVSGTVRMTVEGPASERVRVHTAEFSTQGRAEPSAHDSSFEVLTDGSTRTVETLDTYGLSALMVETSPTVNVRGVEVIERLQPAGELSFTCSDPLLTKLWAAGRRTVSLCSPDAYVDCPTREQRAWVGDAVVHQLVDLTTNTDWSLARWYPRLAATPRPDGMLPMVVAGDAEVMDELVIVDWSLHWIHAVWNLYRYLGEQEEVAALLPVAEGVLRWFCNWQYPDGLIGELPGAVLIDWALVDVSGRNAALNGLFARALREFAEMADWLGDHGRARWAEGCHAGVAAGFEAFWDEERGRYCDALLREGRSVRSSQHAQAAAVVGGLVPRHRHTDIAELLVDPARLVYASFGAPQAPDAPPIEFDLTRRPDPWWDVERLVVRAQPFFRYVVHDALVALGRPEAVAPACRDWAGLLERHPATIGETWFGGTSCHAWSCTPTRDMMQVVLGVTPAEPGFGVAALQPALADLDWASGSVPTPAGLMSVHVTRDAVRWESPIAVVHQGVNYPPGEHCVARG